MNLPQLTPAGQRVMARAAQESAELKSRYLGVEHLFLGVAHEEANSLAAAFPGDGQGLDSFVDVLRVRTRAMPNNPGPDLLFSPRCMRVLALSRKMGAAATGAAVGPAEILAAIVREGRSVPMRLMRSFRVDPTDLGAKIDSAPPEPATEPPAETPLLNRYGRDLTAMARDGKLSPVIGRDAEMDLLAQVLLRRNKNNPVLVGEAGVGKTAIAEGLAQRLVSPSCPEPLMGRRLVELAVGAIVAGTKFRGEFEERLLGLLKEVADHPDVIIFLDEIHNVVGAGATGSGDTMDASNILKPALARGEVRCIGATTIAEYRRHIEKDPALERRFEKVLVDEPSPADARRILERLRPTFEHHHGVDILPEAVAAAVDLTVAHVFDRRLPDKALDAVDQSCARLRLEREVESAGEGGAARQVTAADIATTVSQWTGIPLERISGEAAKSLLNIESELLEEVVGQDHAVRAVARTVLTAKAGLAEPNRPMGIFLFTGPTGVGKTHLAKCLSKTLFGDQKRLVQLDMSEYMEEHSVSKLVGAPPGYVGHEEEGALISALRTHPHCIVLFDEVEKAHPRIFDLFLQIFDEGRLTGAQGKAADFTQAVVILTSNINVEPEVREEVGFGRERPKGPILYDPRDALGAFLRPELINRLDAVIPFQPLDREALRRIVGRYVDEVRQRLALRDVDLVVEEPTVGDCLLMLGDTARFGARELRRVVDQVLRQPLARALVEHGGGVNQVGVSVGEKSLEFHMA